MSLASELDIPESGAVFTFGKSHFADNEPSHFFIKNDPVVYIACGDNHTAVICDQGRVFAFGANSQGQLGLGHSDTVQRPACLKWLKPRRARQVACGRGHTLVLTESNQLFASGDNSEGQLGTGCQEPQPVPQYVEIEGEHESPIREVAAGAEHTVVLTESGKAYGCGSNADGQLGLGEEIKISMSFQRIPLDKNIASVACGYHYTFLITAEGEVFACGDNENQRLGTSSAAPRLFTPAAVSVSQPVRAAACGASHSLLLGGAGDATEVLVVGSNASGQLGLPRAVVDVSQPTELEVERLFDGKRVVSVACGAAHSAFLTEDGCMYTCGDSTHQKLCLDDLTDDMTNNNSVSETAENQYLPKLVTILDGFNISSVACGGCHTILSAKKDMSLIDNNANAESTKNVTLIELPPLQKVPASMNQNRTSPETLPALSPPSLPPEAAETNIVETEKDSIEDAIQDILADDKADKQSINSLEPNVSGSHILNINNDLPPATAESIASQIIVDTKPSDETNIEIIKVARENPHEDKRTLLRQQTVVETIEKTVVVHGVVDDSTKSIDTVIENIENLPETIVEEVKADVTAHVEKIDIPTEIKLLKVPDGAPHSPNLSIKSDTSQKTVKSSSYSQKSENETIICHSDKSSPQFTKVSKTQAVIPVVRADEVLTTANQIVADETDVIQSKISKNIQNEGKKSKFFGGSCMGKGRVLSSVNLKENNDGNEIIESAVPVSDQTNSKTCTIL